MMSIAKAIREEIIEILKIKRIDAKRSHYRSVGHRYSGYGLEIRSTEPKIIITIHVVDSGKIFLATTTSHAQLVSYVGGGYAVMNPEASIEAEDPRQIEKAIDYVEANYK